MKKMLVQSLIADRIESLESELKKLRFDYECRQRHLETGKLLKLAEDKIDQLQQEYDLLKSEIKITI